MRKKQEISDEVRMNKRHGKQLSAYEDALLDLMIRMEESEHYLQRAWYHHDTGIIVEVGETETFPSFSTGEKRFHSMQDMDEEQQEAESAAANGIPRLVRYPKLTAWEWLVARKVMLCNGFLLGSSIFLHIYIVWTEMNVVSRWILQGMKYGCIVTLLIRLFCWILNGGLRVYLNEEN